MDNMCVCAVGNMYVYSLPYQLNGDIPIREDLLAMGLAERYYAVEEDGRHLVVQLACHCHAVYDGGNGTARETLHQLTMHSIVSHSVSKGTIEFLHSDVKEIELSRQLFAAISKGKN